MSSVRAEAAGTVIVMRRMASFGRRHALAIWLAIVPLLTAVLILRHWEEVGRIGAALSQAHPRWIIVGVGIELLTVVASVLTYRHLLRRLGHRLSCLTLVGVHLRRSALAALFFVSGPASVYVLVRILKQRRVPVDDGLLTVALRSVAGQVSCVVVIIAALAVHGASQALAIAAGLLLVALSAASLVRSRWHFRLRWLSRLPFGLGSRADLFLTRLRSHRLRVRDLAWPVMLMLLGRLGPIGLLFASLRALDVHVTLGVVVTAYVAAWLAHAMVPVFEGAGVVEAAAAVALERSGVPAEIAVGVALLWRLMDFWMVFVAGLAIHALASLGPRVAARPTAARSPRPRPAGLSLRPAPSPVPVTATVMPQGATGPTRHPRQHPPT